MSLEEEMKHWETISHRAMEIVVSAQNQIHQLEKKLKSQPELKLYQDSTQLC